MFHKNLIQPILVWAYELTYPLETHTDEPDGILEGMSKEQRILTKHNQLLASQGYPTMVSLNELPPVLENIKWFHDYITALLNNETDNPANINKPPLFIMRPIFTQFIRVHLPKADQLQANPDANMKELLQLSDAVSHAYFYEKACNDNAKWLLDLPSKV